MHDMESAGDVGNMAGTAVEDRRAEDLEILARLRLMDDDFMRCVFRGRKDLVQIVLRTVTGEDGLEVASSETQYDLKWPAGTRSLELDVLATGVDGTRYDLEVQRGGDPEPTRLRYHSSCLDAEALRPGDGFRGLPGQWVVFVMEEDPFGQGRGTYLYERRCDESLLGDGARLLYANGTYRGDDELGRLMHDFNQSDPDEMWPGPLADGVRYWKRNPEGVRKMCQIIEDMRREAEERTMLQNVRNLLAATKYTAEELLDMLKVPKSDQPRYLDMLHAAGGVTR